ncbi:hypothetical protein BaRGS_00023808 [Batillaria attramentaria]|uniref:Fibronectin type-III domain-containing protein n=1 Tax=Batillaria attramentaria TaxID=370345 RepID=A0ABD0KDJ4_9CAEN
MPVAQLHLSTDLYGCKMFCSTPPHSTTHTLEAVARSSAQCAFSVPFPPKMGVCFAKQGVENKLSPVLFSKFRRARILLLFSRVSDRRIAFKSPLQTGPQKPTPGRPCIIPEECSCQNNSVTIAWTPYLGGVVEAYTLELDDGNGGDFRVSISSLIL